ncbi:MAG: ABC transporter ATP-binding protein [Myxococcota bacterium]
MSEQTTGFSWGRVIGLFRPYTGQVTALVGLVLITALLGIVNPLLVERVFDDALFAEGGPDLRLLWMLTGLMLAVTVAVGALGLAQTFLTNQLGQTVLAALRNRLYAHLQQLSLSFYAGARTGELQSRITSDVGGIQSAVTTTVSSLLSNAVSFVSAVIAMSVLSWQLTLVALGAIPLFVLGARGVGRWRQRLTRETQQAQAAISTVTQETLSVSGIVLAKLYGRQDAEIARFQERNEALAEVAARQQVVGSGFFVLIQAFLSAAPIAVYLVAGYLVGAESGLSAGTIVAFTTLQSRLFFPVARSLETYVELQSSRALFERIFDYLDTEPDIREHPDAVVLPADPGSGRLQFANVQFAYPESETVAVEDVSFTVQPERLVALVGPSGSGKSTLLNLAARLYDPTSGTISIDDVPLTKVAFGSLAQLVGLVTQESYLFAGTLRDNIAYGRPDATDADVAEAATAAAIHERILEFTDGYDTVVGERGFRLSGGERQRIAIARVLLSDPRLLILDEATSALDTASERRIQEALSHAMTGRATLAVAHRLSTIMAADVIHVVERGRIVESGTHETLLEQGGLYRGLYDQQFGSGEVETNCYDGVVMADGTIRPHPADDGHRATADRHARLTGRRASATR